MITRKEVKHIARLARLGLTPAEEKKFQTELSSILDYMEKLKEVNIEEVGPTSHPRLIKNVTRKDKPVSQPLSLVNRLVKAAPERKGRYIKVKAIL